MGIAAGKTTVVSIEKSKPDDDNPSMEPESNQEKNLSDSITESNKSTYPNTQPELVQLSMEELAQEELSLRAEIQHLTNELKQLEREKAHESDETSYVQAGQDKGKVKLKLETKKQELRKVALAKTAKSQADLLDTLNKGLVSSYQVPIGIIEAAYNAGSNPPEQYFDLFI
jgi:molecular chaperone GrpE (heat shock protein)